MKEKQNKAFLFVSWINSRKVAFSSLVHIDLVVFTSFINTPTSPPPPRAKILHFHIVLLRANRNFAKTKKSSTQVVRAACFMAINIRHSCGNPIQQYKVLFGICHFQTNGTDDVQQNTFQCQEKCQERRSHMQNS